MQSSLNYTLLDRMGSIVDHVFLMVPKLIEPVKPKKIIDPSLYEKEIDYYFDEGIVDQPLKLFRLNDSIPAHHKHSDNTFKDGRKQIYSFKSAFTPLNPMVRERYMLHESNRTAYFVRWVHDPDHPRKTVVCLHGYLLGEPNQAEKMFSIKKLFQKGLDVVLFVSPFHWKRAPVNKLERGIFLQPDDVVMTCEAVSQTMTDLHVTLNLLRDMGVPEIGLIGASMGGYNASLYSCLSDQIAFSAMIVPALDYSNPFGPDSVTYDFPMTEQFRKKINAIWTLHSPLNFYPKLRKDRILFIASKGDKLCLSENVLRIIDKWDQPRHYFLTGGHWLIFNNQKRGRLWYRFLEEMAFLP